MFSDALKRSMYQLGLLFGSFQEAKIGASSVKEQEFTS